MNFLKRMLKRARESEAMSRGQYSFESAALTSIKAMVEFWADEYTLRGDKMKGQDLVRWKKEVFARIQEMDKIFKEDEKLYKEIKEGRKC